jgi:dTDP-4-amino-4,6-dideoxygalactose transaminase
MTDQVAAPAAFLDLASMHDEIRDELDVAWKEITSTNAFVGGAAVERFENEWAAYCGTGHAIGVANGTDALELILAGLGFGPGDEIIVPANTFIATAEAVVNVGATPVWVDVDPDTLLVTADGIAAATGPRTVAVMVVHLYGQVPDMDAIGATCERLGLAVIEDGAQAQGARWNGRPAGSFGVAAGTSFYPGKNLGAFGDGGAVVTNDAALADQIRSISAHGRSLADRYEHVLRGRNSRLDGLQAAVLSVKLRRLDTWNAARRAAHALYMAALDPAAAPVAVHPSATAIHHLEVVRVADRAGLAERLARAGIGSGVHYPIPCHRQPAFTSPDAPWLPVTELTAPRLLSLPMHAHLDAAAIGRIAEVVNDHVAHA